MSRFPAGARPRFSFKLPPAFLQELNEKLDAVLKPEKEFYFHRFFRGNKLPGEIWEVEAGPVKTRGMILLRRGRHKITRLPDMPSSGRSEASSPYVMTLFRDNAQHTTMRGVTWDQLDIAAIHERAMKNIVGAMNRATVEIMLNTLRTRFGLAETPYIQPVFNSWAGRFNPLPFLGLMR